MCLAPNTNFMYTYFMKKNLVSYTIFVFLNFYIQAYIIKVTFIGFKKIIWNLQNDTFLQFGGDGLNLGTNLIIENNWL